MTIEAKIIADSISPTNARLTTFQLRYPRFIHAEFMTHRLFSRNASSSRAIPVNKIIQQVLDDPAMPVAWGRNQRGMQAQTALDEKDVEAARFHWLVARDKAVEQAQCLVDLGLHKQIANRILEPWHHISVVCTATEFDNFFSLRCHPDAQPEIKALAEQMCDLYYGNVPSLVEMGEWHLPYITEDERKQLVPGEHVKIAMREHHIKASTARCARVSYLTHDNERPSMDKDLGLYDRLFSSKHMSPFEHPATPNVDPNAWSGNFKGWIQLRKTIRGESCTYYRREE